MTISVPREGLLAELAKYRTHNVWDYDWPKESGTVRLVSNVVGTIEVKLGDICYIIWHPFTKLCHTGAELFEALMAYGFWVETLDAVLHSDFETLYVDPIGKVSGRGGTGVITLVPSEDVVTFALLETL